MIKETLKETLYKNCEHFKRIDDIINATMDLYNMHHDCTISQITDYSLEKIIKITNSKIGYLAFLNEDESIITMHSWSKQAYLECEIANKPIVYPVSTTGLWGEAIRQRKTITTNDYSIENPLKKGLPKGHNNLIRHMNVPIFDEGKIVLLLGVANKETYYDETDEKIITLLMHKMWKLIESKNKKKELEKYILQLKQSNKSLSEFAYIASHDLKAPLRAIHNLVVWIEDDMQQNKNNKEYWDLLKNRVKRMEILIEGLLEYSKIGRIHIEDEKIDPNQIIDDIFTDLIADTSNIKLNKTNIYPIAINKIRMFQIFSNLLTNAVKHHNDPSNIVINITCSPVEANGHYLFCVEDNGPGIPEECHEKIFQIFQQLKPKDSKNGAGIGLSIVKIIVEYYNGKIWVESELGKGAKFYFTLPK